MDYEFLMGRAIELAKLSFQEGEVPVGAVIVCDGIIVGEGRNRREINKNALAHAEIEAINNACRTVNGWRLSNCEIIVTLEPCPMCAGAIINSRIKRVVYGTDDYKAGSVDSVISLFDLPYNHKPEVISGILKDECSSLLSEFFLNLRIKKKQSTD